MDNFTPDEIQRIQDAVLNETQLFKDTGMTKTQIGPAVAGAYDRTTGKIYISLNDVDGYIPSELSPYFEEKILCMPQEVIDSYIRTHGAGSHAEIYAANKALLANPNASIDDILIFVNHSGPMEGGTPLAPFPTCPHCAYILGDAHVLSNFLDFFQ